MFTSLSEKLQDILAKIKGQGRLTEDTVKLMLREVKVALLEADVNFKIVKKFIKTITAKAVGKEVLESFTPNQQVVKIVYDELVKLMGEKEEKINYSSSPPTVLMMVGLQGSGKTTSCGKLANLLRKDKKQPVLVACDVYRPAAVKQLQVVGKELDIPVFSMGTDVNPVDIAKAGVEHAKKNNLDLVIIDTAGRLHIDEQLMLEVKNIKDAVNPEEILLVVDCMTGQDAVNVAKEFNSLLSINGVILTKLDGDARGGAALSIREITGKPIKYAGLGEKLSQMELFYPERMAQRILGMGDMLTLIEKAEANFNEEQAKKLEKKIRENAFTLEDFLDQLKQVKKMGPLDELLQMIPGMGGNKMLKGMKFDGKEFNKIEAVINSMSRAERLNPKIINGSRRKRIASGSGTTVQDVNVLLKQFDQSKKMMKNMHKLASQFGGALKI